MRTRYDVFYHALRHSLCEQLKNDEKRADFSCHPHSSSSFLIVDTRQAHETGAFLAYEL